MAVRLLSAGICALGVAFVSGTPYRLPEPPKTPKTLEAAAFAESTPPPHAVVTTFELKSANTLESVTVRYIDGVLDPVSKEEVDHLMRCLRTTKVKPVDPALVDILRDIAHEVDAPLWLVSGYRAKEHWWDHNFHNRAQAADIRVEGMAASKLRKVARKLGIKGVGWYPTTNMIHVDTRDEPYFWTDWSGPHQVGQEIRTL
jgi:uncharacterized protein YcbK (DUF882 family)